ncbi:UDP-forming cellulose synthase catalytic subunit [Sutterella sp.]|uniref:UDP-forming cellulose synthase catalytic subunit n=1 Tax=Sutterella sp. TaxID=1981025 RepID=UPI0026DF5223|nr:UDP-forming cellulose synthase catalytic subunit [Sutterella sp.]MDO5531232.1 UDP-forming cellulose synthase catalytic subunit [Sutterella sp.]
MTLSDRFPAFAGWYRDVQRLADTASSRLSFLVNLVALTLAWAFLPLERPAWDAVRRDARDWFPQVDFSRIRPLDPVRIVLQSAFLLVFRAGTGFVRHAAEPEFASNIVRGISSRVRNFVTQLWEGSQSRLHDLLEHVSGRLAAIPAVQRRTGVPGSTKPFTMMEKLVLTVLLALALTLYTLCVTQPFSIGNQTVFLTLTISIALFFRRIRTHLSLLILITLSILVSTRYLWWRYSETLNFDTPAGAFFSLTLVAAETYAWVVMLLGDFQVFWVLERRPVPCPADRSTWPHVDIFIPSYNEPLEVVRPTVNAALAMDWPREKLHVWILDDGSRDEFRDWAAGAGAGYIRREKHNHAKAGNINHALTKVSGDFVAIFDCDHVPVRSFLQMTVGWMLRDPKIALVQTPHHFYSEDPFERNLGLEVGEPEENALFHDFIQKGNDAWNATMFCGSCAVMRRKALDEVGGIAIETVTEDAHTSLKLNRRGWSSAFIGIPLAAGLSTETLSGHVGQRIRWARGMIQIFRLDNPVFGRGLSFGQRMCFLNAMIHFLHGLPRLIFLLAPLPYLLFGIYVIQADAASIFAFVFPHLVHSTITTGVIQRGYRTPFLATVYEAILSWYILLPTTVALFAPKHGKFNVTAKGGMVEKRYIDWAISKPYLFLIALNLLGLALAVKSTFFSAGTPEYLSLAINGGWTFYNLVILGATIAVAIETVQERRFPRVRTQLPAMILGTDGRSWAATLTDFSQQGASVKLDESAAGVFMRNDRLRLVLSKDGISHTFPVIVRRAAGAGLGLELLEMTPAEERRFTECTFARADAWADPKPPERSFWQSIVLLLRFSLLGYQGMYDHLPRTTKVVVGFIASCIRSVSDLIPRPPGRLGAPLSIVPGRKI